MEEIFLVLQIPKLVDQGNFDQGRQCSDASVTLGTTKDAMKQYCGGEEAKLYWRAE